MEYVNLLIDSKGYNVADTRDVLHLSDCSCCDLGWFTIAHGIEFGLFYAICVG